jgi:hypothetical protein
MSLLQEAQSISIKSDFEAFNFVCLHLLSQNDKCSGPVQDCAYRGEDGDVNEYGEYQYDPTDYIYHNGKACAVGVLIKDEFYKTDLEGNSVDYDEVQIAVFQSHPLWDITERSMALLDNLQKLHDSYSVDLWPSLMWYISSFFIKTDNGYELDEGRDFFSDYNIKSIDLQKITTGDYSLDCERIKETLAGMGGDQL